VFARASGQFDFYGVDRDRAADWKNRPSGGELETNYENGTNEASSGFVLISVFIVFAFIIYL
jgi:hypothetical protein